MITKKEVEAIFENMIPDKVEDLPGFICGYDFWKETSQDWKDEILNRYTLTEYSNYIELNLK